jgi:hypothetical protein
MLGDSAIDVVIEADITIRKVFEAGCDLLSCTSLTFPKLGAIQASVSMKKS